MMLPRSLKVAVPFVWIGMLLAISFMEAPLKFQAPGIDLPLGLGIGRLVFFALNKMKVVCGLLLIFAFWLESLNTRLETATLGSALLILLLESVWLLPVLDARAELVIAGTEPPFSRLHLVYIALDALKLLLLLALGIATLRHYVKESKI